MPAAMRCGNANTPTQPSASASVAASHFGASTQTNFRTVATTQPLQTIDSTTTAHVVGSTSRPNGVYVPAISR